MRILHVTDTFLPRIGGIELHVDDLAARQRARGHQVLVLTAERALGDGRQHRSPGGVPVERLRGPGAGIGVALGPLIASFAPDLVHAHLTVGSPFTWSVLRNTAGVPALATVHSLLPDAPVLVRAGLRLTGLRRRPITFTAVSEVAASRLRAALPPDRPVHVLHNGIEPDRWRVEHRSTGGFHVVSVGRLAARKRPLVLVHALAALAAGAPSLPWTATLVGDGAQRAKVASAIRAHGLGDRIRLRGALDRGAIKALLATADVFVAPARLESFGVAALEARCAGVPIVGMAGSGLTEFVTGGTDGLLADRDDDLAGCLHRLGADPALLERIRRHNSTVAVPMNWAAVLAEHERRYDETVQRDRVRDLPSIGYEPV